MRTRPQLYTIRGQAVYEAVPIRSEEGDGTYYESRTYGSGYERVTTSLLEAPTRGLEGDPFPGWTRRRVVVLIGEPMRCPSYYSFLSVCGSLFLCRPPDPPSSEGIVTYASTIQSRRGKIIHPFDSSIPVSYPSIAQLDGRRIRH